MKSSFASFPMLAIPVLLYNLMAIGTWLVPGLLGTAAQATTAAMITIPMPAPGATLPLSFGHLVLLAGLVALFLELISSTSSSDQALLGDALTLVLFVIAFVEFLLLPPFATGTFLPDFSALAASSAKASSKVTSV